MKMADPVGFKKCFKFRKTELYQKVIDLDRNMKNSIAQVHEEENKTRINSATVLSALLLLSKTYQNTIGKFEKAIGKIGQIWEEKRLTKLKAYIWIAKYLQVSSELWNEAIGDEDNLKEILNRISARLQYLGFIASKFQEHTLRCLKEDNERLQREKLNTFQEELKVGRRDFVTSIVEDYERYRKVAEQCYESSRNQTLVYMDGYKDVRAYKIAYEMCLLLRTELQHFAGFYNGTILNLRVANIDPINVSRWYLSLPNFPEELNKVQTLNHDFRVLLQLSAIKTLKAPRALAIDIEYQKLHLFGKGLLLQNHLDLIEAFMTAKKKLNPDGVAFNAAHNIYETAILFFWQAEEELELLNMIQEPNLESLMKLKDHVHVFSFCISVATHLLSKIKSFESVKGRMELRTTTKSREKRVLDDNTVPKVTITPFEAFFAHNESGPTKKSGKNSVSAPKRKSTFESRIRKPSRVPTKSYQTLHSQPKVAKRD